MLQWRPERNGVSGLPSLFPALAPASGKVSPPTCGEHSGLPLISLAKTVLPKAVQPLLTEEVGKLKMTSVNLGARMEGTGRKTK